MNNLAEILEHELEEAVEVKNRQSLHRYVVLLAENIVRKSDYEKNVIDNRSEIRLLGETMKEGFKAVDKRFEAVDKRFEAVDRRFEAVDKRFEDLYHYLDKRFEDMNKRFNMMFTFMNIGFGIIILLTVLFKFVS